MLLCETLATCVLCMDCERGGDGERVRGERWWEKEGVSTEKDEEGEGTKVGEEVGTSCIAFVCEYVMVREVEMLPGAILMLLVGSVLMLLITSAPVVAEWAVLLMGYRVVGVGMGSEEIVLSSSAGGRMQ